MWKGLLVGGGIAILPVLLSFILPRKKTTELGKKVGRILSKIFQQKVGEKAENAIESTIGDFCNGLIEGMNEDDK